MSFLNNSSICTPSAGNPNLEQTAPATPDWLLLQTVPHRLSTHTSNLPSLLVDPPTSLTSLSVQLATEHRNIIINFHHCNYVHIPILQLNSIMITWCTLQCSIFITVSNTNYSSTLFYIALWASASFSKSEESLFTVITNTTSLFSTCMKHAKAWYL